MKKILSICFGLLVCLVLTACGGSKGEELTSDIIVHVEVNPSFDIHVNNDGTIKSVDCLNEDAQSVYAEMDLTGTAYEDGFKQLLTAIHDAGFMSEDAKITVDIKQKSSVTYDVSKVTDEVIADFDANVAAVESNVSSEVVEEEQTGGIDGLVSSLTNQMNPPWELVVCIEEYKYENGMMVYDGMGEILLNATIKLDENKRIIKVKKGGMYGRKDGGAEENVLDEVDVTGMYLMDGFCKILDNMSHPMEADAEIKAKIWFAIVKEPSPNSLSVEMYEAIEQYQNANGLLIGYSVSNAKEDDENVDEYTGKEILLSDNGDVSDITIRTVESGKWVLDEISHSDGAYSEQHYDESGNIILFKVTSPNGDFMEEKTEYDENGQRTYMYRESTGVHNSIQEYFCENGKFKKTITQNLDEGTVSTTLYDENEKAVEMTTEYADGRKQVVIIENDKVVRGTIYEADGSVVNYDAEGNVW